MSAVKPILLALVLCDSVIRDAETNKHSLIGTFNGIFSNSFPVHHHSLCVYISLTEGRGRVPCKLRMTSMNNDVLIEAKGEITFGDPTSVAELVFKLQPVRLDAPGAYAFEFWAGDDLLGSRKFHAIKMEQRKP